MIPERYTAELAEEYTRKGYWRPITFSHFWDRNALLFPDEEALVDTRKRFTWAEAKQAIDRMALGLVELGIKRDETVLVQLPMCAEQMLLRNALEKAGIVHLSVLRSYRHKEMEHFAKRINAVAIIAPWQLKGFDHLQMIEEIRPHLPNLRQTIVVGDEVPDGYPSLEKMMKTPLEDKYPPELLESRRFQFNEFSWMITTTGTSGDPKLILHTPCHRVYQSEVWCSIEKLTSDDVTAVISPSPTGPNNIAMFQAPMVGAKIVMLEIWDPEEALKLIEKERITIFGSTPAQLGLMLNVPNVDQYDISSMRFVFTTGSPLPYKIAQEAEKKFGCIINVLGAAEIGGLAVFNRLDAPFDDRVTTVGYPIPGNEVRLVDEEGREVPEGGVGEVTFRGPTMPPGFFNDPERDRTEFVDGVWIKTGDQGKWDEKGQLMIVGRLKDIIIRAGQNIFPGEVENMLFTHPRVAGTSIVGMPDPVMGERACAYVVPKAGQSFDFDEMVAFLKGRGIASYKLPERLEVVDELPLVSRGSGMPKVDKKALLSDITEKLKQEGISVE
ncbi:AMP-binding protein [Bacteroidota bacterium]